MFKVGASRVPRTNARELVLILGQDIVDTAIAAGNFKTLLQALNASDLVATLKGPGPFTVFAPTDAAFAKLPPGTVDDLLKPENKGKLADILKSHVLGARVPSADILKMDLPAQVDTLKPVKTIVDKDGNTIKVNGVTVTTADVGASNGIIHVLDQVLMPLPDIVGTAAADTRFTKLVIALTKAGLVETLKGAGPYTVFAPTDAAFDKLPAGLLDELLKTENKDFLAKILQYHVAGKLITAPSIDRMTLPSDVPMLAGGTTKVTKDGNTVKINEAAVTQADIFNLNGMVHVIDTVILPPLNLVETAITNVNFKTLVTALRAADLAATLQGTGPFTVFAPNDAAFAKLPPGTVDDLLKPENKGKLADILKSHVLSGSVTSADILKMDLPAQVDTLKPVKTIVDKDGNTIKVNGVTVTTADVGASNGIIHVLDQVLMPLPDIVGTAAADTRFTKLVSALTQAGLVETLKGAGPYTVFAPTDAAFDKLPAGLLDELLKTENKDFLAKILQYHVAGKLITAPLINRMALPSDVPMLAGGKVKVDKSGNNVTINQATVSQADIFNLNGMVHVIDTVILPPLNLVETAITNVNFKTLVTALRAADLAATLQGTGPFTVFAPNDAAFAKLPPGTVDDLLKPENKGKLADILKSHVLSGSVASTDISKMDLPAQVDTLKPVKAIVDKDGNTIKVNGVTVITPDVGASNGIIHVLDQVLMPLPDIVGTVTSDTRFTKLVIALTQAGLVETLKGAGPYTVFAPTDAAFQNLPADILADLLKPNSTDFSGQILRYHVTSKLITAPLINRMALPTDVPMLAGGTVKVDKSGNNVTINQATVTQADIFNTNGMIHVIDAVLIPKKNSASSSYGSQGLVAVLLSTIMFVYHSCL